jgi:hypothetical protein
VLDGVQGAAAQEHAGGVASAAPGVRDRAPDQPFVRDVSMRRDLVEVRPGADALFDRFERNFTGAGVPKGERVQELQLDVAISKEEADPWYDRAHRFADLCAVHRLPWLRLFGMRWPRNGRAGAAHECRHPAPVWARNDVRRADDGG